MKKWLTLTLALAVIATFMAPGTAQQKGEEKKTERKAVMDWVNGTVTKVDDKTKTISIKRKDGSIIILGAANLSTLPKVGQTVNVQYSEVGGKPTAQSIAVTDEGVPSDKKTKTK